MLFYSKYFTQYNPRNTNSIVKFWLIYIISTVFQGELDEKDEVKSEETVIEQPFQQLFISCPDGLNVKYMLESHVGMFTLNFL